MATQWNTSNRGKRKAEKKALRLLDERQQERSAPAIYMGTAPNGRGDIWANVNLSVTDSDRRDTRALNTKVI